MRFGQDTSAYLAQGAEFWAGQTNYANISSLQGHCYYPGGHLWLYGLITRIFMVTDYCDIIFKVMHIGIHSMTQYFIVKLSCSYFKKTETHRVQMIALMILLNWRSHDLYHLYFNDSFLELFVVLCIYYASANCPISAVAFLGIAITLKAGAILLVPCLFGWVQYQYGTKKLIEAVMIFFVI